MAVRARSRGRPTGDGPRSPLTSGARWHPVRLDWIRLRGGGAILRPAGELAPGRPASQERVQRLADGSDADELAVARRLAAIDVRVGHHASLESHLRRLAHA